MKRLKGKRGLSLLSTRSVRRHPSGSGGGAGGKQIPVLPSARIRRRQPDGTVYEWPQADGVPAIKAGVLGLSNSVAAELRRHGIRVNALVPGGTVTRMAAGLLGSGPDDLAGAEAAMIDTAYMHRPTTPDDIAAAAVYLASDDAEVVTGIALPVDAGMTGAGGPSPCATGKYAGPPEGD